MSDLTVKGEILTENELSDNIIETTEQKENVSKIGEAEIYWSYREDMFSKEPTSKENAYFIHIDMNKTHGIDNQPTGLGIMQIGVQPGLFMD